MDPGRSGFPAVPLPCPFGLDPAALSRSPDRFEKLTALHLSLILFFVIRAFITCFNMNSLSLNAELYASGSVLCVAIVVYSSSLSLSAVAPVGAGIGFGFGLLVVVVVFFAKSAVGAGAATPLFALFARAALANTSCAVAGVMACRSWVGVAGAPEIVKTSGGYPE